MSDYPSGITTFTGNLIDYAGMFPPASLDLKSAFENFVSYLSQKESYMLSKFICPIGKFRELAELLHIQPERDLTLKVSALPKYNASAKDFLSQLAKEIEMILLFEDITKGRGRAEAIEMKIPDELFSSDAESGFANFIEKVCEMCKEIGGRTIPVFFEGSHHGKGIVFAENLIDAVSEVRIRGNECGFKLRTGGTEPEMFPPAVFVSECIAKCREKNVPMKFTAGLHHPFRMYDKAVGATMHGFVNVFMACLVSYRFSVSSEILSQIISDDSRENFNFTNVSVAYRDFVLSNDECAEGRERFALSYGSCSFDEPVDDLRKLKLIA